MIYQKAGWWHASVMGMGGSEREPSQMWLATQWFAASVKCMLSQLMYSPGFLQHVAYTELPFTVFTSEHLTLGSSGCLQQNPCGSTNPASHKETSNHVLPVARNQCYLADVDVAELTQTPILTQWSKIELRPNRKDNNLSTELKWKKIWSWV